MTHATNAPPPAFTYRDAGVDIDAGTALVERIKPLAARTMRPGVMAGIGGFGALFQVPPHMREPVLVSGTDGVGTKLRLAFEWQRHESVGIDLVAMSVNDILVQGAEPLAARIPPMAYDIDSYASLGLLWDILDINAINAPTAADIATVKASLNRALADIAQHASPDLRSRLDAEHRQASRRVRELLRAQW